MKISRRMLVAAGAAVPLLPTALRAHQADTPIEPIDTADVLVLGISPHGETLVGRTRNDELVFLEAESLEEISRSTPHEAILAIDPVSVSWNPNGSSCAFGVQAWLQAMDSDILAAEVTSGRISNLTAEGQDEEFGSMLAGDSGTLLVDVYPTWLDETTILFGRHSNFGADEGLQCELVAIDTGSLETTVIANLTDENVVYLMGSPHVLPDGSIACYVSNADEYTRLALIGTSGEVTVQDFDVDSYLTIPEIDDEFVYIVDQQNGIFSRRPLNGGSPKLLQEVLGLDKTARFGSNPASGPEPGTFVILTAGEADVHMFDGESSSVLGTLAGVQSLPTCHWTSSRLLITTRESSWLIDLA